MTRFSLLIFYLNLSLHFIPDLQSAVCILPSVCILPLICSLQSAFYPQSAFHPWSAVCSLHFTLRLHFIPDLQSAVCILLSVCILPLVCSLQSAFYSQSAFYPRSAVCSLRFTLTALHDRSYFPVFLDKRWRKIVRAKQLVIPYQYIYYKTTLWNSFGTALGWLNSMKNYDIHQKHEVFKNIIFTALEHLRKAFSNDLAEFPSRWV